MMLNNNTNNTASTMTFSLSPAQQKIVETTSEVLLVLLFLASLFIVSAIFIISALFSNKWIIKLFSSVNGSNAIDLPTSEFFEHTL